MKFIFLVLVANSFPIFSADLALLNRCYSQLNNKRIPKDHELVEMVKGNAITASEGCSLLIEKLHFDEQGKLSPANDETLTTLRTLQRLHDSWFPRYNFNENTQDYPNTDLYDANEMGYHYTWVLLNNEPVDRVLTQTRSFHGIRERQKEHRYFIDRSIKGYRFLRLDHKNNKWKVGGSSDVDDEEYQGPVSFWMPKLVEFGRLIGLRPFTSSSNKIQKWLGKKSSTSFDIHRPKGGGLIGSVPYLLLNAGQNERIIDGGNALHRRWSTAVLKDVLCRELPVLKKGDVKKLVRPNSQLTFRQKENCMSCHGTIDPMAALVRNMDNYNSGNVDLHYTIRNIYWHETTRVHEGKLPDRDPYFALTRPEGRLYMRDLRGNLINKKIQSLEALGKALSQTEDFYACTAKRYVEYFTGIEVDLKAKDFHNRDHEFRRLKDNFKKHKSIKKLIREIFHSNLYRDALNG